jgi:hypothetical protein
MTKTCWLAKLAQQILAVSAIAGDYCATASRGSLPASCGWLRLRWPPHTLVQGRANDYLVTILRHRKKSLRPLRARSRRSVGDYQLQ